MKSERRNLEMQWLCGQSGNVPEAQWERTKAVVKKLMKANLTQRQNEIIVLYYYEGLSQREIARRLGVSESCISHIKQNGCKRLRRILKSLWR